MTAIVSQPRDAGVVGRGALSAAASLSAAHSASAAGGGTAVRPDALAVATAGGAVSSSALAEIEAVTAAMGRLTGLVRDASAWSVAERRGVLERLDRAVDGLAAVRAAVLVAERESGAWRGGGDRSFEAWRARTSRGGVRLAMAQVRQADQLAAVPAAVEAVAEGRITLPHAAVIAKVASTGTPAQQSAASSEAGQEHLLRLAQDLDAGTFATTAAQWAATVDPEGLEADHQAQRRERFVQVADTARGTFIKGRLDRMAGHRVRLALEALSPRPAADDDRDAGQRCADALEAMATRVLGLADTRPGGHVPAQVSLIVSAETWAAARAARDRRRAAMADRSPDSSKGRPGGSRTDVDCPGGGRDVAAARPGAAGSGAVGDGGAGAGDRRDGAEGWLVSDTPVAGGGYSPATLEDGTPVPVSELAVVMCDCEITRVVIDAGGVPVDLGRAQRLFTGEQRRAVIARDRECIWPDCHAHARWCEVHHIRWWERDVGPTSVDNGALLCTFHHHEVHRRDLTITRVALRPGDGWPPGIGTPSADVTGSGPRDGSPPGIGARGSDASGSGPGAGAAAGATGWRRARGRSAVALVGYEFRDPTGRLIRAHQHPNAHVEHSRIVDEAPAPVSGMTSPPDHGAPEPPADGVPLRRGDAPLQARVDGSPRPIPGDGAPGPGVDGSLRPRGDGAPRPGVDGSPGPRGDGLPRPRGGGPPRPRRGVERPTLPVVESGGAEQSSPTTEAAGRAADELDFTWTTDPMTGMRVPAFFLQT